MHLQLVPFHSEKTPGLGVVPPVPQAGASGSETSKGQSVEASISWCALRGRGSRDLCPGAHRDLHLQGSGQAGELRAVGQRIG